MNSRGKDHGLLANNIKSTFPEDFVTDYSPISAAHLTNTDFEHERQPHWGKKKGKLLPLKIKMEV